MTTKVQHTYSIGDRVAERPRQHGNSAQAVALLD
jgi:hypothetical protein